MKWLLLLAIASTVCLKCGQSTTIDQTETNVPYVGLVPSTLSHEGVMLPDPVPQSELGNLPELQVTLLTQYYQKWNLTSIDQIKDIVPRDDLTVMWDPPVGASCPTTLSVYVQATDPNAIIFYETNVAEESNAPLNMTSRVATSNRPYIQIQTPFRRYIDGTAIEPFTMRNMTLSLVAVSTYNQFWIRSQVYRLRYYIEGQARRNATGFLVPGIETDGWFIKFRMEMRSSLRAEAAIRQELADYDTTSVSPDPITGIISKARLHRIATGTYRNQLNLLHLTELDPALTGFDGGFPVNTSDHRQYGILVPHHNGKAFFGKVVRIDLKAMDNTSTCMQSYRMESLLADGRINVTDIHGWSYHTGLDGQMRQGWFTGDGTPNNRSVHEAERHSHATSGRAASHACITVLDLESLHKDARGFRKGFVGYPYAYLAAGDFSVVVRLNMENFSIASTVVIDLATVDVSLGGFSGGFTDGSWSCFNPYKTFAGPVGGIRSRIPADANRMYPYYNSRMTCINSSAWDMANHTDAKTLATHMITVDFSTIDQQLRGYSDALRVGRYAYFSPFKYSQDAYSGKFIRLYLGSVDIGTTIANLDNFASRGIHDLVDILDLSRHDSQLQGYSGLFSGEWWQLVDDRYAV